MDVRLQTVVNPDLGGLCHYRYRVFGLALDTAFSQSPCGFGLMMLTTKSGSTRNVSGVQSTNRKRNVYECYPNILKRSACC